MSVTYLGKTALFIDGANIHASTKELEMRVDYRLLLSCFSRENSNVIRAFYYTAVLPNKDNEFDSLRPVRDFLSYNGYQVVTKTAKEYILPNGEKRIKGNMDIELAVDMMEMTPYIETAVLFSGDGDFRYLVEAVQRRGVRVVVISTIQTKPPMIADELRRQADIYIDLSTLRNVISTR